MQCTHTHPNFLLEEVDRVVEDEVAVLQRADVLPDRVAREPRKLLAIPLHVCLALGLKVLGLFHEVLHALDELRDVPLVERDVLLGEERALGHGVDAREALRRVHLALVTRVAQRLHHDVGRHARGLLAAVSLSLPWTRFVK